MPTYVVVIMGSGQVTGWLDGKKVAKAQGGEQ